MRTIHRYITLSFLITFVMTLAIFTFVISIGVVFKATDLIARGVSPRPIFHILLCGIPAALAFSIPMSALTSSLLVFGGLSADGEITAMKACGISMWRMISTPLLLSLFLMVFCIYINNELAPRSHYARRDLTARLGVESPLQLLEEGRFIQDFEGLILYLGKKKANHVSNVRIYDLRVQGVKREIQAKTGIIKMSTNGTDLIIDLFDVRIDPFYDDRPGPGYCGRWPIRIADALKEQKYRKREEDWTFRELLGGMRNVSSLFPNLNEKDTLREKMSIAVELNKRLALSASCFAFVLLGIPLGISAHRKESSIGVGISLILVFNFYLFIIIAESLAKRPEVRPDLIVWLPVLISVTLGSYLVHRAN